MELRAHCKKIILISGVALLVLLVMFFRGPYVSNILKKVVLPEIQAATGLDVEARKMLINVFPFFVEALDVEAFDDEGGRVIVVERVKVYASLLDILQKKVEARVLLAGTEVLADRALFRRLRKNLEEYRTSGRGGVFIFQVKTVTVKEGALSFQDETGYVARAEGADVEYLPREKAEARFSIEKVILTHEDMPVIEGKAEGALVLSGNTLEMKNVRFSPDGSEFRATGTISYGGDADLSVDAKLLVSTVKRWFSLEKSGEGVLHANGNIRLREDMGPFVDLKVKGDFHLETLLELVRARPSRELRGLVSFSGKVSGQVQSLEGTAEASIRDAVFYGVAADRVDTSVTYDDKVLRFTKGDAKLYGGRAGVEVSLTLPRATPFSVDVAFQGADSGPVFDLIGISVFNLSPGKVDGEFHTSGERFAPWGQATYHSSNSGEDVLGKVRTLSGKYRMEEGVLSLSEFSARTDLSVADFGGELDLSSKELYMRGLLRTSDINELAFPYQEGLAGEGEYDWTLRGTTEDPRISGNARLRQVSFKGYTLGNVAGAVFYQKESLGIKGIEANEKGTRHSADGSVLFPEAGGFLDVSRPVFDFAVSVANGNVGELANVFGIDVPVNGSFNTEAKIKGTAVSPEISGSAELSGAELYGTPVSSASFEYSYRDGEFEIRNALIEAYSSRVSLEGMVSRGKTFDFRASSEGLRLGALLAENFPVDCVVKFKAVGSGTFDKPDIKAEIELSQGRFRGRNIGGGSAKAYLAGKKLSLDARLVDGNVSLGGQALLEGDMPWSADVRLEQGRYDFLVGAFLKKMPEDLLLSLNGSVALHGDRRNFFASALFPRLNLSMFGQGFMNRSDIRFSVENRKLSLSEVELRSGTTFMKIGGSVSLNSFYDLSFEGSSSLAPLVGFSDRIESVRGKTDFVFTLRGDWSSPSLNGGLSVSDGLLGLKGMSQRFSAINAFAYIEDDRVVIRELDARVGGGNIEAQGIVQLEGLGVKKILVNALVDKVSLVVSRDFNMNVGGELVLKGTADSQAITGDLQINRASYRERIEWKSWFLFREKKAPRAEGRIEKVERVRLNVRVYGSERIILDNNLARAPLEVDMVVGGTVGSPVLLGRIEANEGKVYFRNSEFNILSATADFVDPETNRPVIRVQAETNIREFHIWLTLDGRAEQFDLTLASDPPLEAEEIVALLTYGRYEELEGLESGIGAAEAASVLTGGFQDVLEERFTEITGLDRFQIDPYVSGASGSSQTISPRITVSKRLMGERLFVTFSSVVGADVEQELKMEYFLMDNISVIGGQDERGGIGADVKFRFRFK